MMQSAPEKALVFQIEQFLPELSRVLRQCLSRPQKRPSRRQRFGRFFMGE